MATEKEHLERREIALALARVQIAIVFGDVLPVDDVELAHITPADCERVRLSWRSHPERQKITFNWLRHHNKRRDRLDVTIHCLGELCGIMLARHSRRRINVNLRYVESSPYPHPLAGYILPVALIIAESFADAYGAMQVTVSQPDRALVPHYRQQGYELTAADRSREKRGCPIRAKILVKTL
ncbi:hypothetical protein J2125_004967 [Erwinia toletana]|uniref:N-acetyltransferase domain-containing protein n=1 Tax=Winslowiella toletana TaxID=92490 RepID=A0ABS4PHT5_9GAMM|nr:hypothetical protein [Winslowiella toletana]MBP2171671.1 hypothetical protein [Winslowiella toletana]